MMTLGISLSRRCIRVMSMNSKLKQQQGFSLVEVLVAALILFSTLAMVAQIFSASTFSANKAAQSARFYQIHPVAISAVKVALRDAAKQREMSDFSGNIVIFGINYQWQAQRIVFLSPKQDFDEDFTQPKRFGLFEVTVNANQGAKSQQFSFEVTTW